MMKRTLVRHTFTRSHILPPLHSNLLGIRRVDTIDLLCKRKVTNVLDTLGCHIVVVVAAVAVRAEAVCVLHAEVEALECVYGVECVIDW